MVDNSWRRCKRGSNGRAARAGQGRCMAMTAAKLFGLPRDRVSAADEAAFFASIRLANGTFKSTAEGRMADLDAALAEELARAACRRPDVLDIGISSGITTVELRDALRRAGLQPRLVGTDRLIEARLVTLGPGLRVLVDPDGHVLQFDLCGLALRPWLRRLDYLTFYWVIAWGLRRLFAGRMVRARGQGGRLRLLTRRLDANDDIDVMQDDLGQPNAAFAGRFDVVRAANVLNLAYFDRAALARHIATLVGYLRPGGWLVLNRTHGDGRNHGTVFRRAPTGALTVVARVGRGSEIESIVADLGPVPPVPARPPMETSVP
jgi:hypothetical protein